MVVTLWSARRGRRRTYRIGRGGFAPALAFLLWALVVCGQQVRSVRGTVIDQNGHVLAGAVVQIRDRTTLQVRSYITRDDGVYHFEDLSPDLSYHLRASYSGVFSRSKILSKFDSDRFAVIDLKIRITK